MLNSWSAAWNYQVTEMRQKKKKCNITWMMYAFLGLHVQKICNRHLFLVDEEVLFLLKGRMSFSEPNDPLLASSFAFYSRGSPCSLALLGRGLHN